jgi:hypothetical protein
MLEWKIISPYTITANIDGLHRYSASYIVGCWGALRREPSGAWIPKNLHIMEENRRMITNLPECQFKTKEEAMEVCERYHKLLILC